MKLTVCWLSSKMWIAHLMSILFLTKIFLALQQTWWPNIVIHILGWGPIAPVQCLIRITFPISFISCCCPHLICTAASKYSITSIFAWIRHGFIYMEILLCKCSRLAKWFTVSVYCISISISSFCTLIIKVHSLIILNL